MSDFILPEVITEILKRLPVESLLRFRCVCREWCTLISSSDFISQQLSHSSSASLSTLTLVITEILKRLPVESLLRFRCVCREWCTLISSSDFISQQLSHSSSSPLSTPTLVRRYSKLHSKEIYTLFKDDTFNIENSTRISFPFHDKARFYFRIVGICNGLLCLSDDLFGYNETVIVWNPSIKRAITLPTAKVVYDRYGPYVFALGFGFDSKINDYKVVRVAYTSPDNLNCNLLPPKVEVLSLSSGVWKRVKNKVESFIPDHFWSQAVIHGEVHWVAYKMKTKEKESDEMFKNLVLKFDLCSEKFSEMGLPEKLATMPPIAIRATLVKEHFAVLYTTDFFVKEMQQGRCVIWAMTEYGNVESWILVYNVELETRLSRFLGLTKDEETLFCGESGELVSTDFESRAVTDIGICGTKDSFFVDKFAESLVLLGKGRKVEKTEPDYEDEDERVEAAEYRRKVLTFTVISSYIKPSLFSNA